MSAVLHRCSTCGQPLPGAGALPLQPREHEILTFVRAYIAVKGYPPTYREIGSNTGLRALSTVHGHVQSLMQKGYLTRAGFNKVRNLVVVDGGHG